MIEVQMKRWHRLLIVLVAMLAVSFLAGRLWFYLFDFAMPSYLAGLIGGFTALPVWELLRRID
jgi:glucose-6-phosphate-specific signal transduction histidine kinase